MILDEKLNFWSFSRSLEWVLNSKKKEGGKKPVFSSKKENGWYRKAEWGEGRGGEGEASHENTLKVRILWKKVIAHINETQFLLRNF